MQAGKWLKIRNGKVDMFQSTMRLCVDRRDGGVLELSDSGPDGDVVIKDFNMSLVEFDAVCELES